MPRKRGRSIQGTYSVCYVRRLCKTNILAKPSYAPTVVVLRRGLARRQHPDSGCCSRDRRTSRDKYIIYI